MIIGAQKAGTTSLKNYLGQHPAFQTHPHKEFSYFFDQRENETGFDQAYKKYFDRESDDRFLLAKNAGLYVNESGLIRLKAHNPGCKLVLILRNPVERTYSSYLMEKNYGAIREPVEIIGPVMEKADSSDWRYACFIGMSLYAGAIRMILRHFPKESLHLVRYEDLEHRPDNCCKEIFSWFGVDTNFQPDTSVRYNETRVNNSSRYGKFISNLLKNDNPIKRITRLALPGKIDYKVGEMLRGINKSGRKYEPLPEPLAKKLYGFYKEHNDQLSELTGIDFSEWNKYPFKP